MSKPPVRIEDLVVPKIIELHLGEQLAADEGAVRTAMDLFYTHDRAKAIAIGSTAFFESMVRDAILFAIDFDDWVGAMGSTGEDPTGELPPMPFKRVAIECTENATVKYVGGSAGNEFNFELAALAIAEDEEGNWGVCGYCQHSTPLRENFIFFFTLDKDGTVKQASAYSPDGPLSFDEMPNEEGADTFRKMAIETIHLLNARGVRLVGLPVPRAQRRRMERTGREHPKVYLVEVGGEQKKKRGTGASTIVFRHRWLVRGHWMRLPTGHMPSGKVRSRMVGGAIEVYKDSFIKGPAGAPWKGRPIYAHTHV